MLIGCDNPDCQLSANCQRWKIYQSGECDDYERYSYDTSECLVFNDIGDIQAGTAETSPITEALLHRAVPNRKGNKHCAVGSACRCAKKRVE